MHHLPPSPDELLTQAKNVNHRLGTLALAFGLGSAAVLAALYASRSRAQPAGPADGAPLMRAPLQVVAPVDLKRYAGVWYEQARLPNRFQHSCDGEVSAEYTPLPNGRVAVVNRCTHADGKQDEASAEARVVPVPGLPGAGRLEVRFAPAWLSWLPQVWGDYWILKLDRDYQVALVGTPNREFLWVLSRTPHLSEDLLLAELEYARTLGFDVDKVIRSQGGQPVAAPVPPTSAAPTPSALTMP